MKSKQLSFLELIKEKKYEKHIKYDATICDRCLCSKCKNNCETHIPKLSYKECLNQVPCWNCDKCYYYGMDNENLSRNIVKFQCDKFEMSDYYKELEVKRKRKSFKIV